MAAYEQRAAEARHVEDMSNTLDTIDSCFHVQGSVQRDSVRLTAGGSVATFPMAMAAAQTSLAPLLAAARPAPFGRGDQTVLDPKIRVAKELAAGEFSVDWDPAEAGVLEQVGVRGARCWG
jgi:hypothetical protein